MFRTSSLLGLLGLTFVGAVRMANAAISADEGFGAGGISLIRVGTLSDEARVVRMDSSGRAVVAGNLYTSTGAPSVGVVRLVDDGSPDPTFGVNGRAVITVGAIGSAASANAMALQPDGKIVVAGDLLASGATLPSMFVARLLVDGTLDTTFDGDGVLMVPLPANKNALWANAVAVQSNGRILIAGGESPGGLFIVGLQSNGSLDTTFGTSGYIERISAAPRYHSLALQADGKILASGFALHPSPIAPPPDLLLDRYLADGAIDPAFGSNGAVIMNVGDLALLNDLTPTHDILWSIAPRPDGRIVIAGEVITRFEALVGRNANGFVGQLLGDGSIDSQFGLDGYVRLPDVDGSDGVRDIVLLPSGDLVAGGNKRLAQISADGKVVRFSDTDYETTSIAAGQDGKLTIVQAEPVVFSSRFMVRRFSTSALPAADNDTVPDPFVIPGGTTSVFGTPVTSLPITITGLTAPAVVTVTGAGSFSIGCVEDYSLFARLITDLSRVCVQLPAGTELNPITQTTLTIGGVSSVFTVDAGDGIPNQFQFVDQVGVTPGTYAVSPAVTITGITSSPSVGIINGPGQVSIGCNGVWLGGGRITNGQTLCVRHLTPGTAGTTTTSRVSIGGVFDDFSSITAAASGGNGSSSGGASGNSGGGGALDALWLVLLALLVAAKNRVRIVSTNETVPKSSQ